VCVVCGQLALMIQCPPTWCASASDMTHLPWAAANAATWPQWVAQAPAQWGAAYGNGHAQAQAQAQVQAQWGTHMLQSQMAQRAAFGAGDHAAAAVGGGGAGGGGGVIARQLGGGRLLAWHRCVGRVRGLRLRAYLRCVLIVALCVCFVCVLCAQYDQQSFLSNLKAGGLPRQAPSAGVAIPAWPPVSPATLFYAVAHQLRLAEHAQPCCAMRVSGRGSLDHLLT
jgi:hypothetical protein